MIQVWAHGSQAIAVVARRYRETGVTDFRRPHFRRPHLDRRKRRTELTRREDLFEPAEDGAIIHGTGLIQMRAQHDDVVAPLRFFGGLSVQETGEALKVSPVTVMRDWSTARARLYREMTPGVAHGS